MKKSIHQFNEIVSPLLQYRRTVTSQSGEDGIIEHIMGVLDPANRYCVEFGAADGKEFSNCYNLLTNKGWGGVMIEGRPDRYRQLVETYRDFKTVKTVNRLVDFEGPNTLDNILTECGAPADLGLISIDIDGNDYHVWDSLSVFRPELVVIEFNPTIPNDVIFIQDRSFEISHGCSLLALVQLGEKKGYELVVCTGWNAFFVKAGNAKALGVENTSHLSLYQPVMNGRIFQGMDNSIHVVGMDGLMWGKKAFDDESFQVVPKAERFWLDALSTPKIDAVKLFEQASAHQKAGQATEALNLYRQALEAAPDYVAASNCIGNILLGLGKVDEAIGAYRHSISLLPRYADAHNGLGVALTCQGNMAGAAESFRRALAFDERRAEFHNNLGIALERVGQTDEAHKSFKRARRLNGGKNMPKRFSIVMQD